MKGSEKTVGKAVMLAAATAISVVLLFVVALLWWSPWQESSSEDKKEESEKVTRLVGEHYVLPTGEQPTVARIQDRARLQDQPFYKDAQNGDYVLIYKNAKQAFLYRESIDKLLNVAPISLDNAQQPQSTGPAGP